MIRRYGGFAGFIILVLLIAVASFSPPDPVGAHAQIDFVGMTLATGLPFVGSPALNAALAVRAELDQDERTLGTDPATQGNTDPSKIAGTDAEGNDKTGPETGSIGSTIGEAGNGESGVNPGQGQDRASSVEEARTNRGASEQGRMADTGTVPVGTNDQLRKSKQGADAVSEAASPEMKNTGLGGPEAPNRKLETERETMPRGREREVAILETDYSQGVPQSER